MPKDKRAKDNLDSLRKTIAQGASISEMAHAVDKFRNKQEADRLERKEKHE